MRNPVALGSALDQQAANMQRTLHPRMTDSEYLDNINSSLAKWISGMLHGKEDLLLDIDSVVKYILKTEVEETYTGLISLGYGLDVRIEDRKLVIREETPTSDNIIRTDIISISPEGYNYQAYRAVLDSGTSFIIDVEKNSTYKKENILKLTQFLQSLMTNYLEYHNKLHTIEEKTGMAKL